MRTAIWLLLLQASLGAFDTLYYHEYKLKLAHGAHTRVELRLHASRDFAYAIIIGSLGFVTWHGAFVWVLLGLLLAEICITIWDFIEEDKIRRLPAGERAMHAVMGIVYGAFLAFLIPQMIEWSSLATGFGPSYHGFPAWMLLLLSAGVFASGIRDLIASAETGGGVMDEFRHYRRWFYAAAAYNAVWGSAVVLFPGTVLRIADMNSTEAAPLVQVIGMMVGVYAYGYYLLAREPKRYSGLIWIALAGKTFGPVGFVYSALTGALPWAFGWICVFNDVIWWPVFWRFAAEHARE